jgi:hypothetical protein
MSCAISKNRLLLVGRQVSGSSNSDGKENNVAIQDSIHEDNEENEDRNGFTSSPGNMLVMLKFTASRPA